MFTTAAGSPVQGRLVDRYVGLAIGSALGGAAIDASGVSGPFVLSCMAAGLTALLALRTRELPRPMAG